MSKLRLFGTFALAASLACTPSAAFAQGNGRGHAKPDKKHEDKKDHDKKHDVATHETVVFDRDGHVRVIHEYARSGKLPPGLAKREALPPGLRAQLHERGELPPGLQKRLIAVPAPLIARLPPVPPYYHRYFAGDDLIVVDEHTHRIVALVPDVWR
jgi:hypothetical protein